MILKDIISLFQ